MLGFAVLDNIFSSGDVSAPITFRYDDNRKVTLENDDNFVLKDDYVLVTKKEYEYIPVRLNEPSRLFREHHIVIPYTSLNSVEFNSEEITNKNVEECVVF